MSDPSASFSAVALVRDLRFKVKGVYLEGELRVSNLRRMPDGSWACECSVPHLLPAGDVANIYGDDPLDALREVIVFLTELVQHASKLGTTVWWLEPGDNGGFDPYP